MCRRPIPWLVIACVAVAAIARAQDRGLRIVVIAGEDAVNIVTQNTAVAPLVEVRDRNDQPVAGALVSFTINGGRAQFAGGLRSVTLTTNAAGRAAVTGVTPTGSGAVQINVAATFQGQTATATITQTNVATAAQATAGASAQAPGGSGSGGGFPAGTIAAVGAATAGALVAVKKLGPGNPAPYLCLASAPGGTGLAGATAFTISVEGCDDGGDPVTYRWDFGDGTILTVDPASLLGSRSQVTHVFQSPGTFDVRVTFSDGESEITELITTVTIVSMAGQWALSGSNNIFLLTQSGSSISGSLSSPTGSGSATGTVQAGAGVFSSGSSGGVIHSSQSDATITLTVPSATGTGVTPGTFTGVVAVTVNSFSGTFTSATGARAATITRQ